MVEVYCPAAIRFTYLPDRWKEVQEGAPPCQPHPIFNSQRPERWISRTKLGGREYKPAFCRRKDLVDTEILSTPIFCRRQYFVAANKFVNANILLTPIILSTRMLCHRLQTRTEQGYLENSQHQSIRSPPRASSRTRLLRSPHANAGMKQNECGRTQPLFRVGNDRRINKRSKPKRFKTNH